MINKEIKIAFEDYQNIDELQPADKALCLEAIKAMDNSHSPYSKFRVGAALRLKSGKIIYGSNQENVAYPSGLCAERVALFHWGANHPNDPIVSMAVTAHTDDFELLKPTTPCGGCLQVIAEYEQKQGAPIDVLLYCIKGSIWKTRGIQSFLPFVFFEDRLQ
jgi:cytidine deaminase